MRYKVSEDFKGTLICKHFGKALYANSVINIEDAFLWEPEVERLIEKGILIMVDTPPVKPVIVKPLQYIPPVRINLKEIQSKPQDEPIETKILPGEPEHKSKVWNFQEESLETAKEIPHGRDAVEIDLNNNIKDESIDFVGFDKRHVEPDKEGSSRIIKIKPDISKTIIIDSNKKEGKVPKTRNTKVSSNGDKVTITPIGEIKMALTVADAAIELDSRGNPLKNTSDHMLDTVKSGTELTFIDAEQVVDRVNKIKRK
jgi:hypothetical protein